MSAPKYCSGCGLSEQERDEILAVLVGAMERAHDGGHRAEADTCQRLIDALARSEGRNQLADALNQRDDLARRLAKATKECQRLVDRLAAYELASSAAPAGGHPDARGRATVDDPSCPRCDGRGCDACGGTGRP